jgi:hypothetical protein
MKGGKGRSSLGSDLTGCYSTLQKSADGRDIQRSLKESAQGRLYLDLLFGMVNRVDLECMRIWHEKDLDIR